MSPSDRTSTDDPASLATRDTGAPVFGAPHPRRLNHSETRPDVIARLEWLDDLMFAAIDGDPVALETAPGAWKKTIEELGHAAVEESRRQYLRHAQSVWNALRHDPDPPRCRIFAAIEIISLLAGKAS